MAQKQPKLWPDILLGLLIFVISLFVYNATLTPSLSFKSPDGNEMATIPYILGLVHMTGYPLYTWLGKLFTFLPIGDVAHRMNLMSAVMGAGGVVLLFFITRELTRDISSERDWISRVASTFTAFLFAFSLTFWSQTGIAEAYAPNIFMLALSLWLLLRWARAKEQESPKSYLWLWVFGLCFGLSLGTHMSNLGFAPGFALFILLVDWRFLIRPKEILVTAAAFALGILQFAWLPFKASTLNDAPMLRNAPNTLKGIYNYTLGAFPQFKFAFPLSAIPERIVLYLYLLVQQYFIPGILFGLHGMFEMLFRKPKRFFLLITVYLVQVIFFLQYRAFDLDVFFIPAHFVFVIFIGFSIAVLIDSIWVWIDKFSGIGKVISRVGAVILIALFLFAPLGKELKSNWEANDYSNDVAINDFYEYVWQVLPPESVLLGRSGVFGYDMFYFRLVYNVRPDVLIPLLDTPDPDPQDLAGREIYSTTRIDPRANQNGPGSIPANLVNKNSWYIPVLLGQNSESFIGRGRELVLYQVTTDHPDLTLTQAQPDVSVDQEISGWRLLGYDINNNFLKAGGILELTLYWQISSNETRPEILPIVTTSLNETVLESHELGLGNLRRYVQEFHPSPSDIVQEVYSVVLPSTLEAGSYEFNLSLQVGYQARPDIDEQRPSINLGLIQIQ